MGLIARCKVMVGNILSQSRGPRHGWHKATSEVGGAWIEHDNFVGNRNAVGIVGWLAIFPA
jgi:hypothetical protein